MNAELASEVREVLADVLGVSSSEVTNETTPSSIAVWDSVIHVSVVMALEGRFGVSFSPEEIPELVSVPGIVAKITTKRGAGSVGP